jgi:hypothetical protein
MKSVNLANIATKKTITPSVNIMYLAIFGTSANLEKRTRDTVMNIAITVPRPEFRPKTLNARSSPSSGVVGKTNEVKVDLDGTANRIMFEAVLIEKNVKSTSEAIFACFFRLGNLRRIPLPSILPWSKPTDSETANVIRKFSSAILRISKTIPHFRKKIISY